MNYSLKKDDDEGLFTEDEIEELNQQLRKQEMILKHLILMVVQSINKEMFLILYPKLEVAI